MQKKGLNYIIYFLIIVIVGLLIYGGLNYFKRNDILNNNIDDIPSSKKQTNDLESILINMEVLISMD